RCLSGQLHSFKVLETDLSYAFLDKFPIAEGHTQIIPKYHCNRMDELPDEYLAEILLLAKKVAKANGLPEYNILQNNGATAFQHIFHVHFHVIPKPNEAEGLKLTIESWPGHERTDDELAISLKNMHAKL
ncbi:HIT domain protein, partial [Tricholoma matsutake]